MNNQPIIWKDALNRKYVILCIIAGGLELLLGLIFIVIYLILLSYTSSIHYFETIPTYIPAIMLIVNGIIVLILAKRRFRYFYLIKISGAFCLLCALICVVITVTTTVIHMNRLQSLQGCEYTPSSSTCICITTPPITGTADSSIQVSGSSHYAFQNIANCEVIHGNLNTCLRGLFGVSVFGILLSIFTSMLVYQLLSHEKKKKYLEQLESRRRFHHHALRNRLGANGDVGLGPSPMSLGPSPILPYPPPHSLANQGCAFMDDVFYPGGIGGAWLWPPPPPPWDLMDYRSYCRPGLDTVPGPANSGSPVLEPDSTNYRSGLLSDNQSSRNDSGRLSDRPRSGGFFANLFGRRRRSGNNDGATSRRRDRRRCRSPNGLAGASVTENRHSARSPNRYGGLNVAPTLPPPPPPPGHFSPLLVPIHPSYRSAAAALRTRSLARLNTRRTRSNDAIFHHLHNMAFAHPPPPPFFNEPPLLAPPQSIFAAWGPPPPYSQPPSLENLTNGLTSNESGANNVNNNNINTIRINQGNGANGNSGHRGDTNSGHHHRRHQINSVSSGLINSDGLDNCSSKLSTPISERRMLCNAFSQDGITLTIGGPNNITTTPSKSSCIVEVHVSQDHSNNDDVDSVLNSESKLTFNTLPNMKRDELSYNPFKSLSNIPINLSNKLSDHHDVSKSFGTIIYEQHQQQQSQQSSDQHHINSLINQNYFGKEIHNSLVNGKVICDNVDSTNLQQQLSSCLPSNLLSNTKRSVILATSINENNVLSTSVPSSTTPTSSSSSGSANLFSSPFTDSSTDSNSQTYSLTEDKDYRRVSGLDDSSRLGPSYVAHNNNDPNLKPDSVGQFKSSTQPSNTVERSMTSTTTATPDSNTKEQPSIATDDDLDQVNETGLASNGARDEIKLIQTQSMPILSFPSGVDGRNIPTAAILTRKTPASSLSSSPQVSPQHEVGNSSRLRQHEPSSGNTSTSQDIADLELELDEEPLCYIPDLPYDEVKRDDSDQSDQSSTPQYQELSEPKLKPPTPFANNSNSPSQQSQASRTVSDNSKQQQQQQQQHQTGDNIIVTIRSIQV